MARRHQRNVNTGRAVRCLDLVQRFDGIDGWEDARTLARRLQATHWVRVVKVRGRVWAWDVFALADKPKVTR